MKVKEQKDYSEFPEKFREIIGTHNEYNLGGKLKCRGVVVDLKWSDSYIMNFKTEEEWYGIQLKFKPDDGSRAIWTKPFKSGIKIEK